MRIRKDDEVVVIKGDDKGKKGKVHYYNPRDNRLLVEGINMGKRHMKPQKNIRQAGIIEREMPIHISNVRIICTKCQKPTKVGIHWLENKNKVRICKSCSEVID